MPKILGAILAGGQSRRFGSDKAQALFAGQRLIDRVARVLAAQSDALVVLGRDEPGFTCLPDRPTPGLGPLGGLCAALHHAGEHGFDAVLAAPCDVPNLPLDLRAALEGEGATIVESQPVVGYWPTSLAGPVADYLQSGERRIYTFARQAGARLITIDPPLMNINEVGDLPG